MDPTNNPTNVPTNNPTDDPTNVPTKYPTDDPTNAPTVDPTYDPTISPTTDPTVLPTESPTHLVCPISYNLDIAFLVDNSCNLTQIECNEQQEGIAKLLSKIKRSNNPRLMYVKFSDSMNITNKDILVSLHDDQYNDLAIGGESNAVNNFVNLYNLIRNDECTGSGGADIVSQTNLNTAINYTLQTFMQNDISFPNRHYKLVIFSNCKSTDITNTCHFAQNEQLKISPLQEVEVIVFNIKSMNYNFPPNYLQCLTEDDSSRYFELSDTLTLLTKSFVSQTFQSEICSQPTNAPTTDPTIYPTKTPSHNPTINPSHNPTDNPSLYPTINPSLYPAINPTLSPTHNPSLSPTTNPIVPTTVPSENPTQIQVTSIEATELISNPKFEHGTEAASSILSKDGVVIALMLLIAILIIVVIVVIIVGVTYSIKVKEDRIRQQAQIERLQVELEEIHTVAATQSTGRNSITNKNISNQQQHQQTYGYASVMPSTAVEAPIPSAPVQEESFDMSNVSRWHKNDILEWINDIDDLSSQWKAKAVNAVKNGQFNGQDLMVLTSKNDVAKLFDIQNPMLCSRLWKELKKIK
eukprot:77317_1